MWTMSDSAGNKYFTTGVVIVLEIVLLVCGWNQHCRHQIEIDVAMMVCFSDLNYLGFCSLNKWPGTWYTLLHMDTGESTSFLRKCVKSSMLINFTRYKNIYIHKFYVNSIWTVCLWKKYEYNIKKYLNRTHNIINYNQNIKVTFFSIYSSPCILYSRLWRFFYPVFDICIWSKIILQF